MRPFIVLRELGTLPLEPRRLRIISGWLRVKFRIWIAGGDLAVFFCRHDIALELVYRTIFGLWCDRRLEPWAVGVSGVTHGPSEVYAMAFPKTPTGNICIWTRVQDRALDIKHRMAPVDRMR